MSGTPLDTVIARVRELGGFSREPLPRFLAKWKDGIARVIHAQDWTAACDLARHLSKVPLDSVQCLDIKFARLGGASRRQRRGNSVAADARRVGPRNEIGRASEALAPALHRANEAREHAAKTE